VGVVPAHVISSDDEAREVAARIGQTLAGDAAERDRERRLPWAEVEALSASGLLGITVPRRFGGVDVSAVTLAEVIRLISAGDSNVGQIPQSHFTFLHALRQLGTEDQQRFFFAEALAGRRFGNAQAERGSSEGRPFATRVLSDGRGALVVNGRKSYCTGALFADWIPVVARGEDDKNYIAFVPAEAQGVKVIDDWDGMGQRVTASGTVELDDVVVPMGNVIAHHQLFTRPSTLGALAQLVHAAIDTGLAQGALDEAVRLVRDRGAWWEAGVDRAADDALLVQRFGELAVSVAAARALAHQVGDLHLGHQAEKGQRQRQPEDPLVGQDQGQCTLQPAALGRRPDRGPGGGIAGLHGDGGKRPTSPLRHVAVPAPGRH
jgi:alkylation response protein AidB-like acyl-CoA dehydrogenase